MNTLNGLTNNQPAPIDSAKVDTNPSKTSNASLLDIASLGTPLPPGSTTQSMSNYLKTIQALSVEPTFDTNKVAAIRNDIASGTYKVNTDKIAAGLISSVSGMLMPK
jgi:flagellar biosynthesis anti-sigma factor FlgM